MSAWFSLFLDVLTVLTELVAKNKATCASVVTVICFGWNVVTYPRGAVNQFMIMVVDMIASVFPSTPSQYQLYSMLDAFAAKFPQVGWGVIYEIFSGISGMLGIYLTIKLWRLLPFGGSS